MNIYLYQCFGGALRVEINFPKLFAFFSFVAHLSDSSKVVTLSFLTKITSKSDSSNCAHYQQQKLLRCSFQQKIPANLTSFPRQLVRLLANLISFPSQLVRLPANLSSFSGQLVRLPTNLTTNLTSFPQI